MGWTRRRVSWLLGAVILGAVVAAALHFSEGHEFVRLAERAEPVWLLVALGLQAGTYLLQGETWRRVARTAGFPLSVGAAFQLSLAKLFVDQAIPSAGISGTVLVTKALEERAVPRAVVTALAVIATTAYNIAYVLCLVAAIWIAAARRRTDALIIVAAMVFAFFGLALIIAAIELSGRVAGPRLKKFERVPMLRKLVVFLEDAERRLVRSPRIIIETSALQLGIFLLDVATMWALIRSMGVGAAPGGVFASFMISNLLRTIGIVPGGLGTFEATSVLTLKLAGLAVPVALAATLLFRGLSFWLPMLPGVWLSHRVLRKRAPEPRKATSHRVDSHRGGKR